MTVTQVTNHDKCHRVVTYITSSYNIEKNIKGSKTNNII